MNIKVSRPINSASRSALSLLRRFELILNTRSLQFAYARDSYRNMTPHASFECLTTNFPRQQFIKMQDHANYNDATIHGKRWQCFEMKFNICRPNQMIAMHLSR